MSQLAAPVAALAPIDASLTGYDQTHAITYLRLLDAEKDGAEWQEVARLVLGCDPNTDPDCAWQTYESHLRRAHWMTTNGYEHLLRGGAPH